MRKNKFPPTLLGSGLNKKTDEQEKNKINHAHKYRNPYKKDM